MSIFQLAGILLDTQNLNVSAKLSMTRDAEAVQLLSVGSAPNYGNALYDQCMTLCFSIIHRIDSKPFAFIIRRHLILWFTL